MPFLFISHHIKITLGRRRVYTAKDSIKTLQQIGITRDCTVRITSTCPVEHIARIREEEVIMARIDD